MASRANGGIAGLVMEDMIMDNKKANIAANRTLKRFRERTREKKDRPDGGGDFRR